MCFFLFIFFKFKYKFSTQNLNWYENCYHFYFPIFYCKMAITIKINRKSTFEFVSKTHKHKIKSKVLKESFSIQQKKLYRNLQFNSPICLGVYWFYPLVSFSMNIYFFLFKEFIFYVNLSLVWIQCDDLLQKGSISQFESNDFLFRQDRW